MEMSLIITPPILMFLSIIFLSTKNFAIISNALKIPLILPNSPESPKYIQNNSRAKTIKNLLHHSKNRYLSVLTRTTSKFNQLEWKSQQELRVEYAASVNVKLGMGTFETPISYKSYYLNMDTGSELTWLQCEDCLKPGNKCFGDPPEFFPNTKSNSYNPIPCNTHELCYKGKCEGGFCSYDLKYIDESSAFGILASETFTFDTSARQNDINSNSVFNLIFGCNIRYSGPDMDTVGILGLGWGPRSLFGQIKTQVRDIFSYCFPHYDEAASGTQGYLKLGLEGDLDDDFSYTALRRFGHLSAYFINLEGISLNRRRLPILSSVFTRVNNKGGTVIDSGSTFTLLTHIAYMELEKALIAYFESLKKNYQRTTEDDYDLCYTGPLYAPEDLPSITLHFLGADLYLKPENVFIWLETPPNVFCLAIFDSKEKRTLLAAYQQSNYEFVYDRIRMLLLFKPSDNCQY